MRSGGTPPRITLGTKLRYARHHVVGFRERDPMQHMTSQERKYLEIAQEWYADTKLKRVYRTLDKGKRELRRRGGRGRTMTRVT